MTQNISSLRSFLIVVAKSDEIIDRPIFNHVDSRVVTSTETSATIISDPCVLPLHLPRGRAMIAFFKINGYNSIAVSSIPFQPGRVRALSADRPPVNSDRWMTDEKEVTRGGFRN